MWPIANFIKGLTIDEAIKQLKFLNKKGALIAIEVTMIYADIFMLQHLPREFRYYGAFQNKILLYHTCLS